MWCSCTKKRNTILTTKMLFIINEMLVNWVMYIVRYLIYFNKTIFVSYIWRYFSPTCLINVGASSRQNRRSSDRLKWNCIVHGHEDTKALQADSKEHKIIETRNLVASPPPSKSPQYNNKKVREITREKITVIQVESFDQQPNT